MPTVALDTALRTNGTGYSAICPRGCGLALGIFYERGKTTGRMQYVDDIDVAQRWADDHVERYHPL